MAQVVPFIYKKIVSYIGANLISSAIAAHVIGGVIVAGLAVATARAFGAMMMPDIPGIGPNPGTRIQLSPDTGNKLQIVYGDVLTSGPICDANISNENKMMHYFTVLSEKTDSGTFTIGSQGIRFGDKKLNFGTGASAHIVQSVYDANGTSNTNWSGKIRVRVYAGGTAAGNQIFPVPGGGVTAVAATTMMPHWDTTTNYKGTDLVFAMTEIDYDQEEGLVNMEPMTFNLVNSLTSPGNVVIDYMTNSRYGAGIANTLIDFDSFTGAGNSSVGGYGDETVSYTPYAGGSATQPRFQINGTLGTIDDVQTNLDKLMSSCGSFLLFDGKQGKYKGLPNQIYQDQTNCFVANDDNIIGKISVQNTDLYQQYNAVEVEYFDKERRDQRNSVLVETPSSDRNTGEPDNKLSYSLDMVNNKVSVEILANIDLKQTRLDKVVTFTGDHSFLQVDVGDVIKLTNETYGFTDKLFKVMQIKESEAEDTTLTCQVVCLEYADSVYTTSTTTLDAPFANVTIPTLPVIGPIYIPGVFNGTYNNITLDQDTFGNVFVNEHMKTFGAGTQLAENPNNVPLANALDSFNNPPANILLAEETFEIDGINLGDYELTAVVQPAGTATGSSYDYGFRANADVVWANATATHTETISTSMQFNGIPDGNPPTSVSLAKKMNLTLAEAVSNGAASDMTPANATIRLEGYNNLDNSPATRQMSNMGFQFLRVTKGEK